MNTFFVVKLVAILAISVSLSACSLPFNLFRQAQDIQTQKPVLRSPVRFELRAQKIGTETELQKLRTELNAVQSQSPNPQNSPVPQVKQSEIDRIQRAISQLYKPATISNADLKDAFPQPSQGSVWSVAIQFNATGGKSFAEVTRNLAGTGRTVGIFLDGILISAPVVDVKYAENGITGGQAVITGNFTVQQASELATQLKASIPQSRSQP